MNETRAAIPVWRLAVILGAITAFAPLATDMYLSSFPALARDLRTDAAHVQSTLSVFFIGLAVGQVFYGPVADRFGRRLPLLAGTVLFVAASIGAALSPSVGWLIWMRLAQAVGGCAGMVMGRAIVSDLYSEREGASVLSLLMLVQSAGPIVAPVLGTAMLHLGGWRTVFWFLGLFALACAAAAAWGIPESLPPGRRHGLHPGAIARSFAGLLATPGYTRPLIAGSVSISVVFAYITGSPTVFIQLKGLTATQYALLFAGNAGAMVAMAQVNRWALARRGPAQLLRIGLLVNAAAAACLLAVGALPGLWIIPPLALCLATVSIIAPNYMMLAMMAGGARAGNASALMGVVQFALAAAASLGVSLLQNGTVWPMTAAIAICAGLGAVLGFLPK